MSDRLTTDREVPIPRHRRALLRGLVRLAELGGAFERRGSRDELSRFVTPDDVALAEDWERVGLDMSAALKRAARETGVPEDAALAVAQGAGE